MPAGAPVPHNARMPIGVGATGTVLPPLDAVVKTAQRNEEQGYDTIWWPDHLMGWHPESIWTPDQTALAEVMPNPHTYLDPVPVIAAVAQHTERIRLGTAVTEAVRNHPAQLARAWLTLDHLTRGRAILGIGAGEGENCTPYGIPFERVATRLEDALRVVRLLWESDDPVDYEGPVFELERAVLGMGPYFDGRFPEIWVAAHGPRMCRITGELADGWLPTLLPVDDYAERLGDIRDAARAAGRGPDAILPGMWTYTVVAEDHETAHRLLDHPMVKAFQMILPDAFFQERGATHPLGDGYYGLTSYVPTRFGREEALQAVNAIPFEVVHDATLHGTPAEIAAKVERYASVGLRHIALWNVTFFADPALIGPSFGLLRDAVQEIHQLPY